MENKNNFPLRHISIRVPWHDKGWDGSVCSNPEHNISCLRLKRIAESKNEEKEKLIAGKLIKDINSKEWPSCVSERAMFMADFDYVKAVNHPYVKSSKKTHGHFQETNLRFPSYSAGSVPFRWMLKETKAELEECYPLHLQEAREPKLGFPSTWWQEKQNQKQILDCFFNHVQEEESLCFFYAKQIPHVEDSRRVIIGVGRVKHISGTTEYKRENNSGFESVLWERMVQHSIRPGFKDGFILPYQQVLDYYKENPDFDFSEMIAFAPWEHTLEFSFATEHVSHDAAIESLIACANALEKIKLKFDGPWDDCLKWIDNRLSEAWKLRGPYPGLGACLSALGIGLGTFVAKSLEEKLEPSQDLWELVEMMFTNPSGLLPEVLAKQIGKEICAVWNKLSSTRRNLIKLLSRFELTKDQVRLIYIATERAANNVNFTDEEIIENPYLIYEKTRLLLDPISVWTIDKGLLPSDNILEDFPIAEPSGLSSKFDYRRLRAIVINCLEDAANEGHTLLPKKEVIRRIQKLQAKGASELHEDFLNVVEDYFNNEVIIEEMVQGAYAYQLQRFAKIKDLIRTKVNKRLSSKRMSLEADWRALLDRQLGPISEDKSEVEKENEERARIEKSIILKELAESRFSVLIGPAGTGKTTLLSVLISHEQVKQGEILLLAPTGKARVRMEQVAKNSQVKAYTVAQFLGKTKRYDYRTCRYVLKHEPGEPCPATVIVDEASMLTEEMMASLFESLKGVKRLIFVGDPNQLPPIGAGRPFVDIVSKLAPENLETLFPKVGIGYGQLTVTRRQDLTEEKHRDDLRLAQWFSKTKVEPSEDELFDPQNSFSDSKYLRFERWQTEEELPTLLKQVLVEELKLDSVNDEKGFEFSLGGVENEKGYINFNFDWRNKGENSSVKRIENWQILSPVRNSSYGVTAINRLIHQTFRKNRIEQAQKAWNRWFPKPMGSEQLVYGDKVINISNHGRKYVFPSEGALKYIANGEIGLVVGEFNNNAKHFNVEFSSQLGYNYEFFNKDFKEEGDAILELAYALTVHKSQGSEFGLVIIILPNPCRLLTPELLYTALTRQKKRIVILHQGLRTELMRYTSDSCSETARRYTNLFDKPNMIEVEGTFLENRLIHRTSRGELVRSKSEVIIADLLYHQGVDYDYERELKIGEATKYPDFTIEDDDTGENYFWEHCGMLSDPSYRERWQKKLKWYKENGILPLEEGGNLIITEDSPQGGIDSAAIRNLINRLF